MARIVFAGELSSSRSQLRRSLLVAEHWRAGGHDVAFIVPDVIAANALLTPKGIPFVPAPRLAKLPLRSHRGAGYWMNLAALGYDDRESLQACVRTWVKLFDSLAADAIVIDHAPTARLAARISQRPTLLLDRELTPPPDRHADAKVLENIETVVRALSGATPNRPADPELPLARLRDLPMQLPSKPAKPKDRRRILYAWELGTNAGHLERGLAIAEALRGRGHEVVFVVRDLVLAERLLGARGFAFMPTPYTPLLSPPRPTLNFSDLLLTCGFDDATAIGARVQAWTHLLRVLNPDAYIIDHAPSAQLAAYIADQPSILIDSGFSIPPLTRPFPSLQPHARINAEQLASADRRALTTVNDALSRFGARPLLHLSELFARSPQIITTFKELDTYPERGTGLHVGPVERSTDYTNAHWRTVGKPRVFAYLRPFINGIDALLQSFQTFHGEVKCVLPSAPPALVRQYQAAHFEIFTEPIELGSLLKEADVVVSYGSAGLLAQALLAGVPLLLLADVLEQIINSVRVVELGAGIFLREDRDPAAIAAALTALTSQTRYRAAARDFAARYRNREPSACERIVAAIEQSF